MQEGVAITGISVDGGTVTLPTVILTLADTGAVILGKRSLSDPWTYLAAPSHAPMPTVTIIGDFRFFTAKEGK